MAKVSAAVFAALVASTAAFAPQQSAVRESTLSMKGSADMWKFSIPDGEIWDPMGFSKLSGGQSFDTFMNMFPDQQYMAESEIKHGRQAMLAWTGVWATSKVSGVVVLLVFRNINFFGFGG
jgi:Chlorophyll A-B binding protein